MAISAAASEIDKFQVQVDRPLQRWNQHVDECTDCLTTGLWMCAEGEELADQVRRARLALVRAEARVHDRRSLSAPAPPAIARFHWLGLARIG